MSCWPTLLINPEQAFQLPASSRELFQSAPRDEGYLDNQEERKQTEKARLRISRRYQWNLPDRSRLLSPAGRCRGGKVHYVYNKRLGTLTNWTAL